MAKVLQFRSKGKVDKTTLKLLQVSDELDAVILKHLADEAIDPKDLIGLISHRLGSLIKHIDDKSELWSVCETILKRQAMID